MRRVAVTPTFAAGLGVVVAAVLAYPMQTVFSYVAPGALGRGGFQCTQAGCGQQAGHGKPAPFGAGGGLFNPAQPGSGTPDGDGTARQQGGAARPHLSYQITRRWQGGFWGQITITFPGPPPPQWRLRLGYSHAHILGMNPVSHLAPNGHAVVVRASDYSGGTGPGGRTFVVGVGVEGVPAHPVRCLFDGRACHIPE
jgi:Cellulose binding domain